MSKKGILSSIIIATLVCIGMIIIKGDHKQPKVEKSHNTISEKKLNEKKVEKNIKVGDLHSDILRLISSSKKTVCGISPNDADKELKNRTDVTVDADKKPTEAKDLPFDILSLIVKSPASIAGIKPKIAGHELVKRYLSIDIVNSQDVNSSILLEALQHHEENKAIQKWADNEDAEAVEAFMKEEADKDPSSVANFAYGLKHLTDNKEEAITYMDRYAKHVQSDAFDDQDEAKSQKILIDTIKKLK